MTYDGKELTAQDSQPVTLFQFIQGGSTFRYTSIDETITRSGYDWYPISIKMGPVSATGDIPKEQIWIELPWSDSLALTFVRYPLDIVTTVTVFRTHYDDTGVITAWKGRVVGSVSSGNTLRLTCEPIFTSLQRRAVRVCFQRMCPYVFGAAGTCNFPVATVTTTETATAVNGAVVTVPSATGLTNIEGGTLAYGGVTRMILEHSGASITLMRSNVQIALGLVATPAGVSVDICQACSHELDDPSIGCRARGNAGNFGGWPGIPLRNPMSNSIAVKE